MGKVKVLFCYMAYPFTIANYFRQALEERDDVELLTCGAYTGDYIPWANGMHLPQKYVKQIDIPLPSNVITPPWAAVKPMLPWKPDLVLQVDAGWHFTDKPDCLTATVATDPHVLKYDLPRSYSDKFFGMQKCYAEPGDIYLPYAYSPKWHFPEEQPNKYDACIIGLHYETRNALVSNLQAQGLRVYYDIGPVYDDYRHIYNQSTIGIAWSCLNDMIARVFEVMAMKRVPVINRVPDLPLVGLQEGIHYIGFDNLREAVTKINWAMEMKHEAQIIAENAYRHVTEGKHDYNSRVSAILQECGFG